MSSRFSTVASDNGVHRSFFVLIHAIDALQLWQLPICAFGGIAYSPIRAPNISRCTVVMLRSLSFLIGFVAQSTTYFTSRWCFAHSGQQIVSCKLMPTLAMRLSASPTSAHSRTISLCAIFRMKILSANNTSHKRQTW